MQQFITFILVFGVIGLGFYWFITFFNRLNKGFEEKTNRQFQMLSHRFALSFSVLEKPFRYTKWNAPELKGQIEGIDCHIFITEDTQGEDTKYYTCIEFIFDNEQDLFFELYLNSIGAKILQGKTPIDFGDKAFEKRFSIRTTNKELVKKVFHIDLRSFLVKNKKQFLFMSNLKMKRNQVTIQLYTKIYNDRFRKQIETMLEIIPQIIRGSLQK